MYFLSNFAILTEGCGEKSNKKGVVMMGDSSKYDLGATIKAYRKNHRYSQSELAKKIGISQSMISQIELGTMPSKEIQKKIADFLNIPVSGFKKKLTQPANKEKYSKLVPEDFVSLYNARQPILVKMLHGNDNYEYGEIFPAIIGVKHVGNVYEQDDLSFEFVIIYNYNCTLDLSDYGKTWMAYKFDNALLNEKYDTGYLG